MNEQKPNGWIGIDLDGTLAHYVGWDGGKIGQPIPLMVARAKAVILLGFEIRIFTARVSDPTCSISAIQDWCEAAGIGRPAVTNLKDFAMIELWDDRCVAIEPNTGLFLSPSRLLNHPAES